MPRNRFVSWLGARAFRGPVSHRRGALRTTSAKKQRGKKEKYQNEDFDTMSNRLALPRPANSGQRADRCHQLYHHLPDNPWIRHFDGLAAGAGLESSPQPVWHRRGPGRPHHPAAAHRPQFHHRRLQLADRTEQCATGAVHQFAGHRLRHPLDPARGLEEQWQRRRRYAEHRRLRQLRQLSECVHRLPEGRRRESLRHLRAERAGLSSRLRVLRVFRRADGCLDRSGRRQDQH